MPPSHTNTSFGRYQAPEPPASLQSLHLYLGAKLKTVDHEPRVGVLDQEDLHEQGIYTSRFVSGGRDEEALGSCTCQTLVEALSNILPEADWCKALAGFVGPKAAGPKNFKDVVGTQRGAIALYDLVTHQTGNPSTEWPPTDCGSSGPYLYQFSLAHKLISSEVIAHGGTNIVSALQTSGLLLGTPWLNDWMDPSGPDYFIDGDGSASTLQGQINNGVAGGHEIYISALEKLALYHNGSVNTRGTIVRIRNHWSKNWADHGSARIHLSTLVALGQYTDIRRFVK